MSAEIIRHTQDGSSLSPEDQAAFDGIVDRYEDEYRALTEEASEQERYREALNPQQATPEEWESLTQITKPEVLLESQLPEQEHVQQRLAAMTAKFHETQALLPPYEDTVRWEARSEKTPLWKRVTSFFSRRKGSEQAWYPGQRPIVRTLAMGSVPLASMYHRFDSPIKPTPNYPSTLTNTQERRV